MMNRTKCWNWCPCDGARVGQANWGKVAVTAVLVFDGLITIEALGLEPLRRTNTCIFIHFHRHTVHLVTFRQIQLDCTKHILKASQHHMNSTRLCNCNCNCRQCARLTQHTVHLTGGRKLEVGNSLLKQCGVLRSSIRECWWILLLHPMMQWHFSNADMNEMWYKTLNWNSWA